MIERGEYKGKPLIVIKRSEDDKFPFSFGLGKARLILENFDEIKKFVEENTTDWGDYGNEKNIWFSMSNCVD